MKPHTHTRLIGLLALALVAGPLAQPLVAQAQESPSAPRGVRLYPRAGLLAPDAYFYEYFKNFTGDGLTEWTTGYLGRAFVAGAGVEVRMGRSGAYLRGEVLRSFDGWLSAAHNVETLRDLFFPPEVVTTWLDVPMTMTMTSVQLVLPTKLELGPFKPYVLMGGGGKFYTFEEPTEPNEVEATLPDDGFTWGGDVGAGFTFRAVGLQLDVQARDVWSKYWGKFQHDVLYTGTLSLGLF